MGISPRIGRVLPNFELSLPTGNYVPTRRGYRRAMFLESAILLESPHKVVASDEVFGLTVSTIFLTFDHAFDFGSSPVLWETMIFGPSGRTMGEDELRAYGVGGERLLEELGGYQWRYRTRRDAKENHRRLVGLMHMAMQ